MTKPHHRILFAKYARGEELIEKKKTEKLNLTHSKLKFYFYTCKSREI